MTGRVPGSARTPGSGRRKGSIDKAKRELLSAKMAGEIWATFKRLGPDWLYDLAQKRPDLFVGHFLVRLLPPALKDAEGDGPLVNIQFSGDPIESARRVAFLLAKGADQLGQDPTVERQPYVHLAQAQDPAGPSVFPTDPGPDPLREEWIRQAGMTPEERLNAEDIDAHTNRRAFAETSAPAVQRKERTPVRLRNPRNRDDLL